MSTVTRPASSWWRWLPLLPLPVLLAACVHYGLAENISRDYRWMLACWAVLLAGLALPVVWLARSKHPVAPWITLVAAAVPTVGVLVFAGPTTVLAGLLLALAAIGLGSLFGPLPAGLALAVGLAVIAALVGWSLPLPVHARWGYLAAAVLVLLLRWRAIASALRRMAEWWRQAAAESPGGLLLAIAAAGIASLGLWLPSLNYDDNAVHLILQAQLLADGQYHMDVQRQSWAVAPWANNVLHAVAAMLAGQEARAAMGALWLLLGMDGARRLALALDAKPAVALVAAAVFAAQPFTGYFATTMQVDGASAALLLQLAAIAVAPAASRPGAFAVGAIAGLLLSLKTINLLFALPLLAWIAWSVPAGGRLRWLLRMLALLLPVAASSYAYALLVTGNPLFPFFNAWFQSPLYPLENFRDTKWMAGASWRSAWDLLFASNVYGQYYPGASGIAVLTTLPASIIAAIRDRRVRWLLLWALAVATLLFLQMQYLRYLFPALAVLAVVGIVALARMVPWRGFAVAALLLVVVDAALMPTTSWYLRDNQWLAMLRQGPSISADIIARAIPERTLLARVVARDPNACVLMTDPKSPFVGAGRGHAISMHRRYDPVLWNARNRAVLDPSGGEWASLLERIGASHVIVQADQEQALVTALGSAGYTQEDQQQSLQAWRSPQVENVSCGAALGVSGTRESNLESRFQGLME